MTNTVEQSPLGTVSTRPVKRFFVEMLTRDIALEDAILDLLDNCVDGILRREAEDVQAHAPTATADGGDGQYAQHVQDATTPGRPYDGFWAHINVSAERFVIEDNCGGIPWSEHTRAFRMGNPDAPGGQPSPPLSVGTYGIGMKRAIFKMGTSAEIRTQHKSDNYTVPISADWMATEDEWDLPVLVASNSLAEDGTVITVQSLHPGVMERFGADGFQDDLLEKIQSHYAVLIHKGFEVKVNGTAAMPKPILFRFASDDGMSPFRPYMFQASEGGVEVFVAIGLRDPIPDVERLLDEQTGVKYSSEYAGWTVICNDRVVLYCNRDELTGWGTAGVPRYHTQFISISGVVEFRGDASKLPTTTTKRGLDFSSALYQQVLNRMREGMRVFVDYTNKWKARQEEAKAQVSPVPAVTYPELREKARTEVSFTAVHAGLAGQQYKPKLPMPPNNATDVRISYFREKDAVIRLAEHLVPDWEDMSDKVRAREVGQATFDRAYTELVAGAVIGSDSAD